MLTSNQIKSRQRKSEQGFTLIELSIVLVIIGLIVGGVLVGQDLIRAAEIRATISQIEKFNTATNTFRGKFNAIPGDMNYSTAATFGFNITASPSSSSTGCAGRSATITTGQGDGNGILEGSAGTGSLLQASGETGCYWVDISSAAGGNLVDGGFSQAIETGTVSPGLTSLVQYYPAAKLGRGNMIYVYSVAGINYYGMSNVSQVSSGVQTSTGSLAPIQAYNIDKKVDDGYPQSGNVTANYLSTSIVASSSGAAAASPQCYDTADGAIGEYETTVNQGQGTNCGLQFKFQ